MNIAEAFVEYMEDLSMGTLGSTIYINSVPQEAPDAVRDRSPQAPASAISISRNLRSRGTTPAYIRRNPLALPSYSPFF